MLTAVYILQDVYDKQRFWYIPPILRQNVRGLDLCVPVGSNGNFVELIALLRNIDNVDWNQVSVAWEARDDDPDPTDCLRRKRTRFTGHFVYFDPLARNLIRAEEAAVLPETRRVIASGHLTALSSRKSSSIRLKNRVQCWTTFPVPDMEMLLPKVARSQQWTLDSVIPPSAAPAVTFSSAPPSAAPPASASAASAMTENQQAAVISQFLQNGGLAKVTSGDLSEMQGALQAGMGQDGTEPESGGTAS